MKAQNSVITHIDHLDTSAIITVGKSLANRATGLAIFAVMAGIRERLLDAEAKAAVEKLVGKDLRAANGHSETRDPVPGMEPRKTWRERLHDAAKLHEYGANLCENVGSTDWDMPQTVASRVDWNISTAAGEVAHPPKLTNSVAANAAATALVNRNREQLEFMQTWKNEIISETEAALAGIAVEEAEEYVASLTGLDRYAVLITCVTGLARQMVRLHGVVGRLRPGSELAKSLSSELGALELAWKQMRNAALDSEKLDAAELLTAISTGRTFRDLGESDKLITDLGIDVEAACA